MAQLTLEQVLQMALECHRAGRLAEAETLYQQILAHDPNQADATRFLGILANQMGRRDMAVELIRRAIALRPGWAEAYGNLGNVLRAKGEIEQAILVYRQAISLAPDYAEAHNNLGDTLRVAGQIDAAIAAFEQAIAHQPGFAEALGNLGNALKDKGQLDQAIAAFGQAIAVRPNFAEVASNLADALRLKGLLDESEHWCRHAIKLKPDFAGAYNNLGNVLREKGQLREAVDAFNQAIYLTRASGQAHGNLGNALRDLGQLDDAAAAYRQAIEHNPNDAYACNNLGNLLKDQGQIEEAIAAYRQAVKLEPANAIFGSNLIFALHLSADCDAQNLTDEHQWWNRQYAQPLAEFIRPHNNDRSLDRRLRIGYVSADFRHHPVGSSLRPLLAGHDRERFEIFCYAKVVTPDAMTAQLQQFTDCWRNMVGVSDDQMAAQIQADKIDILVDLSLHTAGNSLPVFARRPAPVQVSYLGYCSTTGLSAIDYRFSDRFLDPLGTDLSLYSEKTVFLEPNYWCYAAVEDSPEPSLSPAKSAGFVTFGCLNNFSKVSRAVLQVWVEVLRSVPGSRLLLHAGVGSHRQRTIDYFVRGGVEADRIEFIAGQAFFAYLQTYNRIDVALDPFPYCGGITSCDSLWMGVPLVTLAGKQSPMSRGGCSVLGNVGLNEFIASSVEEYVSIAVKAAGDLPRLTELRRTLRTRMQQSPLMDGPAFVKNIEAAYRRMWHNWCTDVPTHD